MSCPTIVNEYRACAGELTECDHLRFWEGRLRFCMLSASRTLARTACQSHSLEKKIQKPRTTEVRRGATHTKATLLARIQAVSHFFGLILTL